MLSFTLSGRFDSWDDISMYLLKLNINAPQLGNKQLTAVKQKLKQRLVTLTKPHRVSEQ